MKGAIVAQRQRRQTRLKEASARRRYCSCRSRLGGNQTSRPTSIKSNLQLRRNGGLYFFKGTLGTVEGVTRNFTLLLLALAMLVSMNAEGEIFKWVDDAGNVHFGDSPPEGQKTKEIEIPLTPSKEAVREAQERAERLKEFERGFGRRAEPSSAPEGTTRIKEKSARHSIDIACFSSVEDSWGGCVPDSRDEVVRRELTPSEVRKLRQFLRPMTRHSWRGVQKDITCTKPDASPPSKILHYDFRLRARWESDELFGMEADLVGKEHGSRYRQFFWFSLSQEGVRFRSATTDISFNINQPGYDVGVLTVANDELTFFKRRSGRQRKAHVLSLRRSGTGFTLDRFFYTQGVLTGKQHWKLGR